jgi:beta-mannosidase
LKEEVQKEVDYQVRRLRNHPCIAVWSGNNEISITMEAGLGVIPDAFKALFAQIKAMITTKMYTDYLGMFDMVIPTVVNKLSPEIPYVASSPTANFEPQSDKFTSGDRHNYEVWWNNKPIESQAYFKDRFVSETGIQGFPDMATIDQFTEPDDRSAASHVMNAHQKNFIVNGNTVIGKLIKGEYNDPADFATFDYLSQVIQGRSLDIYSEALRRRRPFSMGIMYWQLNDSWPVISWATMDYYGRPKAGLYMAKHYFSPVLASPFEENGNVNVYVVSDKAEGEQAKLNVRLMDFTGKVLYNKQMDYTVKPLSSHIALSLAKSDLAKAGYDPEKTFIAVSLTNAKGEVLSTNNLYFKMPKELRYEKGKVDAQLSKQGDHYVLKISSPVLAPNVAISFCDNEAWLSDNYFDLLPNEPVTIEVKSDLPLPTLQHALKVMSVNNL